MPLGVAAVLDWFLAPQGWVYGALAAAQCCAALLAYLALRGPEAPQEICSGALLLLFPAVELGLRRCLRPFYARRQASGLATADGMNRWL